MIHKKKIVILGANGFIGHHLVNSMANLPDAEIYCFDKYSRPQAFNSSENVKKIKGDFFNIEDTDGVLKDIDYLVHCFTTTTPHSSNNDPYTDIKMLNRNVEIFEKCIENNVKKIIFISSGGAIYGNAGEQGTAKETDTPTPVSPYGICKLATEHYLEYFNRKYNTPYIVYRLTNPYGPGQIFKKNQGVIPAFINNIADKKDLVIYGDGESSRDFIYIEDAVKMILDSFMQDNRYTIYNIGSGLQTKINDIVEVLKELVGQDVNVIYKDAPETYMRKTSISINRFSNEFGKPKLTSLKNGIQKVIDSPTLS